MIEWDGIEGFKVDGCYELVFVEGFGKMKWGCGDRVIEMEGRNRCGFLYFRVLDDGCIEGNVMMLILRGFVR